MSEQALQIQNLVYRYGDWVALDDFSLSVGHGSITGLLGPNGGGKTTLFRILSTLKKPASGSATLLGLDLVQDAPKLRKRMGVVFQNPSLDKKLRVIENLRHQGHLYGLSGAKLKARVEAMLDLFKISDRAKENVESLSGGLQRRVELAKSLLHEPEFLLMDEPSTGLDPGARIDLWTLLEKVRSENGVTILLTTHLMEEAAKCDRVAIIHEGKLVAEDTPDRLQSSVGGDVLSLDAGPDGERLLEAIQTTAGAPAKWVHGEIRIETADGPAVIAKLMNAHSEIIRSIRLGRPTLEDVFVARTGHRLSEDPALENPKK